MISKGYRFQKGQALPVGLALFMFLGLTSFVLYNTGQTASDKTRIVNTADAAAYSGLLWQARAMNFQAYTNRAMVANQVAMAQAVSLNSWSNYIEETGSNIHAAVGWIPYVGTVTKIIETVGQVINTFMNPITKGMLSVINGINSLLGPAQSAMYYASFAATPDVVNSVVEANRIVGKNSTREFKWDTAYSLVSAAGNLDEWRQLTDQFDKQDKYAMAERAAIVNKSTDKFTQKRDWKFFNFWIPTSPVTWHRVEKAGTTRLIEEDGEYEWKAKDDVSFRTKRYTWRGKKYSELPVGYAESFANSKGANTFDDSNSWFGRSQRSAQRLGEQLNQEKMSNYGGLQAYRSLTNAIRESDEMPSLLLRVEIELNTAEVDDAASLDENLSNVDAPGHVMTSVASAELYFERPCINSVCKHEYANGYNPFWDVRLKKSGTVQRMAAYATRVLEFDESHLPKVNLVARLPSYGTLATPVDDFKEQAIGLYATINGMESRLEDMLVDSDEYRALESKLNGIKDQINEEIQNVAAEFAWKGLSEEEVVPMLIESLGIELTAQEQSVIDAVVAQKFDSIDDIIEEKAGKVRDELRTALQEEVEKQLQNALKNAVADILKGMVSSYASGIGGGLAGEVITATNAEDKLTGFISEEVDDLFDRAANSGDSESIDPITFDVNDECSIYREVLKAEIEVEQMQEKLRASREQIISEFQIELDRVSEELLAQRAENLARIAEIYVEIDSLTGGEDDRDSEEYQLRQEIKALSEANAAMVDDRINILTHSLIAISNNATKSQFPDYSLDYRLARKAVEETLQDTSLHETDEIGVPDVADAIYAVDFTEEIDSDNVQEFTEKPENC